MNPEPIGVSRDSCNIFKDNDKIKCKNLLGELYNNTITHDARRSSLVTSLKDTPGETPSDFSQMKNIIDDMKYTDAKEILDLFGFRYNYVDESNYIETVDSWKDRDMNGYFNSDQKILLEGRNIYAFLEMVRDQAIKYRPTNYGVLLKETCGTFSDKRRKELCPKLLEQLYDGNISDAERRTKLVTFLKSPFINLGDFEELTKQMNYGAAKHILDLFGFKHDYMDASNNIETVDAWKTRHMNDYFTHDEKIGLERKNIYKFLEMVRNQAIQNKPKDDGFRIYGTDSSDGDPKNPVPRKNQLKGITIDKVARLKECLKTAGILSGGYQNYSLNIQSGGEESYGDAPYSNFFEQQYKHVFDNNVWTNIFENAYANLAANGVTVQPNFKTGIDTRIKALNEAYRNLIKARRALELTNNSNPMYAAKNMINTEGLVNNSTDADLDKLARVPYRVRQLVEDNNQKIDRCQNSLMKNFIKVYNAYPGAFLQW